MLYPPQPPSFHCVPVIFLRTLLLSSSHVCATSSASDIYFLDHLLLLHTSISFLPTFLPSSLGPFALSFCLALTFALSLGHLNIVHPSLGLPLAFHCLCNSQSLPVSWTSNSPILNFFILLPALN